MKTLKTMMKSYIAQAIFAGAMVFGSSKVAYASKQEGYLLASRTVKQEVVDINESDVKVKPEFITKDINEYRDTLKDAETKFNKYINDGFFSLAEQRDLYRILKKASEITKKYDNLEMPKTTKNLYYLLDENVHSWNSREPKLEKKCNENGCRGIIVETNVSRLIDSLKDSITIAGFVGVIAMLTYGGVYLKKRGRKNLK